jgi:hypothetical protein
MKEKKVSTQTNRLSKWIRPPDPKVVALPQAEARTIYSKPFGNTSPRGSFGGSGFTTGQEGALQGFLNVVNAGSFDAQAFVSALQGVLSAFGGSK